MRIFRTRTLVLQPFFRQQKFYFSSKNDGNNGKPPPDFDLFDDTLDEAVDKMTEEYLHSKGRKMFKMPEPIKEEKEDPLAHLKEQLKEI